MVRVITLVLCCIIIVLIIWVSYLLCFFKICKPGVLRTFMSILVVGLTGPGVFYLLHKL